MQKMMKPAVRQTATKLQPAVRKIATKLKWSSKLTGRKF